MQRLETNIVSLPAEAGPTRLIGVALPCNAAAAATRPDSARYRLSKRLWSLEVHRRLELRARRAVASR